MIIETVLHSCDIFKKLKWHQVKTMCYLYLVRDTNGFCTGVEIAEHTGIDPAVQVRILNNLAKSQGMLTRKGRDMFQLSKKGMRIMMDMEASVKLETEKAT